MHSANFVLAMGAIHSPEKKRMSFRRSKALVLAAKYPEEEAMFIKNQYKSLISKHGDTFQTYIRHAKVAQAM